MLVPKQRISKVDVDGQKYRISCWMAYDTEECGFIENRTFSTYNTREECQQDIDFYKGLSVVKVS